MKFLKLSALLLLASWYMVTAQKVKHVWEKQELTFTSKNTYKNAYTDVTVWVDLVGTGVQ